MNSSTLRFPPGQLQAKYKHAADFGVTGEWSATNAALFRAAVERHVHSPATRRIEGTFRGRQVVHYIDLVSALDVMVTSSGAFVSGWRLNPQQLRHVLKNGRL